MVLYEPETGVRLMNPNQTPLCAPGHTVEQAAAALKASQMAAA